jgi:hypothetical protein
MAMAAKNEPRAIVVCVDECLGGEIRGRYYNSSLAEEKSFRSLAQLLMGIEQTLELIDFPKSYTATRSFTPEIERVKAAQVADTSPPDTMQWQSGTLASFSRKTPAGKARCCGLRVIRNKASAVRWSLYS